MMNDFFVSHLQVLNPFISREVYLVYVDLIFVFISTFATIWINFFQLVYHYEIRKQTWRLDPFQYSFNGVVREINTFLRSFPH